MPHFPSIALLGAALAFGAQVALARPKPPADKAPKTQGMEIAGQQPAYIFNALKAYKSGERSHPSMRGIAASLSEETMKQLADYYGGAGK